MIINGGIKLDKVFTETGLWLIEKEPNLIRIGLSLKGQDDLGEVNFFDPFEINQVTKDEPFCSIEAAKAVTELESPVTGNIVNQNEALLTTPENLNEADDDLNWIIEISVNEFNKEEFLKEDLPFED